MRGVCCPADRMDSMYLFKVRLVVSLVKVYAVRANDSSTKSGSTSTMFRPSSSLSA